MLSRDARIIDEADQLDNVPQLVIGSRVNGNRASFEKQCCHERGAPNPDRISTGHDDDAANPASCPGYPWGDIRRMNRPDRLGVEVETVRRPLRGVARARKGGARTV